jgi:NADPH:quinone reductase-like Zn-dependent oxidoreductase
LLDTLKNLAIVAGRGVLSRFVRQRIRMFVGKVTATDLTYLAGLCETGRLTPVIDRCYALADTAEAIRVIEGGHARGKVIVTP